MVNFTLGIGTKSGPQWCSKATKQPRGPWHRVRGRLEVHMRASKLTLLGCLAGSLVPLAVPAADPVGPAAGGRAGEVTIYRDGMGVPHVFAATSAEVMFGAGYAQAQDRLAALELARRAAVGRRAELLGESALASDRKARDRMLGEAELLRMYRRAPQEHQEMMQAFVDGINAAIAEVRADPARRTPLEFIRWGIEPTPWTLLDYLAYVASIPNGRNGYELQNLAFLTAMIARHGEPTARKIFDDVVPLSDPDSPTVIPRGEDLAPPQPMHEPAQPPPPIAGVALESLAPVAPRVPYAEVGASRCLVLGPQRTASGNVLMMEATADGPEAHLYGGGFDAAGFGFAGWGAPKMGRGPQHGWLLTSGHSDTTDTFVERLHPTDRYRYWFKGEWRLMERRMETIRVKGGKPVQHEVAWTIHGPVISRDASGRFAYTIQWAGRGRELDTWVGMVEMARARSIDEFESQGVERVGWNLGICYGGDDGQIAFWEAGSIPKRAPGVDPRLPTPGTGEYEWTGFLSTDELPRMRNPKQGYIHAWNSKATTWSLEGDDGRFGAAFRTWLGNELAASSRRSTLLDMRRFNQQLFNALGARDRTLTTPRFFEPQFRAAALAASDPEVRQAVELMLAFNGRYEDADADDRYDAAGLTLFRTWLKVAPEHIFGDDVGDWWSKVDESRYLRYQTSLLLRALQGPAAGRPLAYDYFNGRDRTAVLIETLRITIDRVRADHPGKAMTEWRLPVFWKYYDPAAKLADRPPLPGTDDSPRLSAELRIGPVMARHNGGEGWVGLMELGPRHRTLYSVVDAGGQSQFIDPNGVGNPHLTDQTMMHETNELKRITLDPDEVRANAVSTRKLTYRPSTPRQGH
jgi:acyl-homoserine lactone acylase PvdQ